MTQPRKLEYFEIRFLSHFHSQVVGSCNVDFRDLIPHFCCRYYILRSKCVASLRIHALEQKSSPVRKHSNVTWCTQIKLLKIIFVSYCSPPPNTDCSPAMTETIVRLERWKTTTQATLASDICSFVRLFARDVFHWWQRQPDCSFREQQDETWLAGFWKDGTRLAGGNKQQRNWLMGTFSSDRVRAKKSIKMVKTFRQFN